MFQSESQALEVATRWLPLFQSAGALASIIGAIASWRFAKRAAKARDEMTANVVAANCVTSLDRLRLSLSTYAKEIHGSGDAWFAKLRELRPSLLETLAESRGVLAAAEPYLGRRLPSLKATIAVLDEAHSDPLQPRLDRALKAMASTLEELRVAATTRNVVGREQ
jgi:hypothetical protein